MKSIKVIRDPEAFQLLGDETRRKIVFLLRVKDMTVSQIASDLKITPQAVYHHIKKLQGKDIVEVAREERVGHLIESYYRATAEAFICSVGKTPNSLQFVKEQMKTILNALQRLGFDMEYDDGKISDLVEIQSNLHECCSSDKFGEAISELDNVDFLTKQEVREYAEILSMSDEEYDEQNDLRKKFRDLLVSLIKK